MAAQHLPQDLVWPSTRLYQLTQMIKKTSCRFCLDLYILVLSLFSMPLVSPSASYLQALLAYFRRNDAYSYM